MSALAIADFNVRAISTLGLLVQKRNRSRAAAQGKPRIISMTNRAFRGDNRAYLLVARHFFIPTPKSDIRIPIPRLAWGDDHREKRSPAVPFLARRMALEHPSQTEFAQLMTDHVLGDKQLVEDLAVMDFEGVPYEFRDNRTPAIPSPDRQGVAALLGGHDFAVQLFINVPSLFCGSRHVLSFNAFLLWTTVPDYFFGIETKP